MHEFTIYRRMAGLRCRGSHGGIVPRGGCCFGGMGSQPSDAPEAGRRAAERGTTKEEVIRRRMSTPRGLGWSERL